MAKTVVVGYPEIADMMKISVAGVMKAARVDPKFPKPITPPSMHSKGWDQQDIQKYLDTRVRKSDHRGRGRPPIVGSGQGTKRYKLTPEVNAEIERRVRAAGTFAEFVALAELSDNALRQRFAGKTSWRESELDKFAQRLGTTFEELTSMER